MISTRILCQPFVGRATELDHLTSRRRAAGEGRGGLVLIGGEPGIGKSRMLREFRERLNRHTTLVLSSGCRSFAQKPLGPLLDVLAQIPDTQPEAASASKAERLDDIAQRFERVAAKRLAVVIIEDVHWADVDLLQTLLVLSRRAATKRLLFVATYRDNELVPEHPLFRWFGELVREPAASLVTLTRFEDDDMDRLITFAVADKLSLPVLRAVRERSDGNPLFAEELLRSAVDSLRSGLPVPAMALPLSLHALIRERLRDCSEDERSLLRRASLFGRAFDVAQLAEIFGDDPNALRLDLKHCCDLQMLDGVDDRAGSYQFRHALTRDVVYGEMPVDVTRPLHLTIAEHLEQLPAAASLPEDLAHHFWEAGCRERAASYYEAAADAAMAVFAYEDAAAFYERAAAGFENDRKADSRVRARSARALIFAGELDDGLAQYEQSVRIALELGDVTDAVRSRALMAGHMFDGGRREGAIDLIRQTLSLVERGDPALRSRLLTRLAMTLARDGRLDEAWEALGRIEPAGLDSKTDTTGEYYLCAAELHALRAEVPEWKSAFKKGAAIYEALGHPGPIQIAHANFAVQALCIGETAIARDHHQTAVDLGRTLHLEDQAILLAQVELYAGALVEARKIVAATKPSRKFLIRAMQAQVAIPLALALGDDRLLDEYYSPDFLAESGAKPFTAPLVRVAAAQALAFAAKGRMRDARAIVARVVEAIRTPFGMMQPIAIVTELSPERAIELKPMLAKAAARPADRVNKALLSLLDARADKESARDAAQRFASIGWPLFEARCRELAGEREAAREIYLRCGAAGDIRRWDVRAMAGDAHAAPLGALTSRERELALLIAAGKPNREAAAELSITEKAVEKYLTSIYAKFGLKSRAQLAAFVASSQALLDR